MRGGYGEVVGPRVRVNVARIGLWVGSSRRSGRGRGTLAGGQAAAVQISQVVAGPLVAVGVVEDASEGRLLMFEDQHLLVPPKPCRRRCMIIPLDRIYPLLIAM